jgi:hypothetical protein
MQLDLSGLDEIVTQKKPTELELIYYIFWDKGFSITDMNEMPLPYIFSILRTHTYIKEEEEKAMNKARRQ